MTRPRSNALQTGKTIRVSGYRAAGSIMEMIKNEDVTYVYCRDPQNLRFMKAYQGSRRGRNPHPCKGWKLHISAYPYNAIEVAKRVLPVLCKMKIWHKYVSSPMYLSHMTDGQRGKFITVYTRDEKERDRVVDLVTKALSGSGLDGPPVKEEKEFGPMIYGRYSYDYNKPNA